MLLLLLVTDSEFLAGKGSVRIFTILFGFLVLVLLLPGLNIMVLQGTPEGKLAQTTARDLLEVARFVLIGVWPGNAEYCTTVRLNSPTYYAATLVMFLRWVGYAARPEQLHLDDAHDDFSTTSARRVVGRLAHSDEPRTATGS